jgi:hypothetical protein
MVPVIAQTLPPAVAQPPEDVVIGSTQPSSAKLSRRWWVWAVPTIIAGGLALAIILPLTAAGSPKTTSKTTLATPASQTGLTGSYIATAAGPAPLHLTLVQSGTAVTGTITGVGTTAKPPLRLTTTSVKVTGSVSGKRLSLDARAEGQQWSLTGSFSGGSLTLDSQGVNVVFRPGTTAQFDALVARDRNSLLAQATLVASRAAESNLTNALTEAIALYQATQAYASSDGQPYGAHDLTAQAPEFTWTTGSCRATTANCISFQVMDLRADHDAQGVALAALSAGSSTCWYAIDIEATPVVIPNDASAFLSSNHSANAGVKAGTSYARSPIGSSPMACTASLVLHAHRAAWSDSYSTAGGLS